MISKNRVRTADDFFAWCERLVNIDSRNGDRKRQIYFNALKDFKSALADRIRASEVDPFSDSKIPDFVDFVRSRWNEE